MMRFNLRGVARRVASVVDANVERPTKTNPKMEAQMKRWISSAWFLMFLCSQGAWGQGTTKTVFPPGFENQSGNAALGLFTGGFPEYQQLYRASALAENWQTPVMLKAVTFRVANGGGSFNAVIPSIEIRLSTSPRAPEQMELAYSSNRGLDETTVYNHQDVAIVAAGGQGVNPFEVSFKFDTPFVYDPNTGHLLMYIRPRGAPGEQSLDAQSFPNLSDSPFAAIGMPFLPLSPYGLITEFEWTTVPEPNVIGLVVFGSAVAAVAQTLRKDKCIAISE